MILQKIYLKEILLIKEYFLYEKKLIKQYQKRQILVEKNI